MCQTLKRRSSVFDDEVASVGPMRRIRQKSNLSAPRFHHTAQGVGVGSHSKQKPGLMGDQRNVVALKNIVENENQSVPSSSYARVPSRSSEVAAKILQQLENVSPKEKSSDSKLVAVREKWPLKSTLSKLSGQALRNREDKGSSKFLLDDQKVGDNSMLPDARDSSSRKQVNAEENHHKASAFSSGPSNSVLNNDSAVTLRTSRPSIGTADLVNNGASQPPQKKRAFRMSAEEVIHCFYSFEVCGHTHYSLGPGLIFTICSSKFELVQMLELGQNCSFCCPNTVSSFHLLGFFCELLSLNI